MISISFMKIFQSLKFYKKTFISLSKCSMIYLTMGDI